MAYVGSWGTFIHIPKCGGLDIRARLDRHFQSAKHPDYPDREYIEREEIDLFHTVPGNIREFPPPYFAIVRHPVTYLRSLYCYMVRKNWRVNEFNFVPNWPAIVGLVKPYARDDWDEFVEVITKDNPGVVSAIFRMYWHPTIIRYYKLENIEELYADLGMNGRALDIPRAHVAPWLPAITPETADRIIGTESWSLETFGYTKDDYADKSRVH